VLCCNSTIAICTSPCTIINQRGAAGGAAGCCALHTTAYLLLLSINEQGADCALGGLGTVLYVPPISPCTVINFDNQRGVAGSARETSKLGG
jgi:hypothetical protein